MAIPSASDITRSSSGTSAFAAGGSGPPSGNTGEIQYNNGGSFGGAPDAGIEGGQLRLAVPASEPATPAANGVKIFGKSLGGRILPIVKGPSGLSVTIQPHIGRNAFQLFQPAGNSTTITAIGSAALGATGTATAANWATTNSYTKVRKLEYLVTTASTSAVAGFRAPAAQYTIGNPNGTDGCGGFHMICTWGPATGVATATNRAFVGMGNSVAAPTDVEPSTITNIVGMGWDAADTNIQIMYRGTGTVAKIDLGANFPVPTVDRTKLYELILFSPPNTTTQTVGYRVEDLTTGAVATGTLTTNLPTTTTALAARGWMSVGGTSSVVGIALVKLYIEADL